MIDGEIQSRAERIENGRYESHNTLPRTALRMSVVNPVLDSYAINSYGKVNYANARFSHALKTGVYSNTSIAGGNIFGEKLGKTFYKGKTNFERMLGIQGKYSFNFVTKKGLDSSLGVADDMGENILRTGTGFSRNYTGLFDKFRGITKETTEIKEATKAVTKKVGTQEIGRTKRSKTGGKVFSKAATAEEIITTKSSLHELLDNGASKEEVLELIKKQAASSGDELIKMQKAAVDAGLNVNVSKIKDLGDATKMAAAVDDFIGAIDSKFFKATKMEKIFGSETMMFITGAGNLAGKAGTAVQLAAAVTSAISATHQESAIQNSVIQRNFNLIKGEETLNEKSFNATSDNRVRSDQNSQELNYIINSNNNAESFRKEAGGLEIDRTKSNMSNFTIY